MLWQMVLVFKMLYEVIRIRLKQYKQINKTKISNQNYVKSLVKIVEKFPTNKKIRHPSNSSSINTFNLWHLLHSHAGWLSMFIFQHYIETLFCKHNNTTYLFKCNLFQCHGAFGATILITIVYTYDLVGLVFRQLPLSLILYGYCLHFMDNYF